MKRCLILVILNALCIIFLSAQEEAKVNEQIIVLFDGAVLSGNIEAINKKYIRFSKDDITFNIQKKNIRWTSSLDIVGDKKDIASETLVVFKNNYWLKGQILRVTSETVLLKSNGVTSSFPMAKISMIQPVTKVDSQLKSSLENEAQYQFRDLSNAESQDFQKIKDKIYNITYGSYYRRNNKGRLSFDDSEIDASEGFSVQHTVGYEFNKYFGLGLNFGFASFQNNFVERILNACNGDCNFYSNQGDVSTMFAGIAIRGGIGQKKIKPYYNFDFGFTKALRGRFLNERIARLEQDSDLDYDKKTSRPDLGLLLYPSIGAQIRMKSIDFLVDFGYQYANLNFNNINSNLRTEDGQSFSAGISQVEHRTFIFRIGVKL